MHRRKHYYIYPPHYKPGDGYQERRSKIQAWKAAVKMGAGAEIVAVAYFHPAKRTDWRHQFCRNLWRLSPLK